MPHTAKLTGDRWINNSSKKWHGNIEWILKSIFLHKVCNSWGVSWGGRVKRKRKLPNTWREFRPSPTTSIVSVCYTSYKASSFLSRTDSDSPNFGWCIREKKQTNDEREKNEILSAMNIHEVIYDCFVVIWFGIAHKMCSTGGEMICERVVIFHIYCRMLINRHRETIFQLRNWMNSEKTNFGLGNFGSLISRWRRRKIHSDNKSSNNINSMFNKIFFSSTTLVISEMLFQHSKR